MISVIIPAYNASSTIGACLESIFISANENVDYEIIVVNDGSSDETESICQKLAKNNPRIRYFSKPNGGVSSARNFGMEKAKGEYVCFVDADDKVLPEYLSSIASNASRADITFFGFKKHIVSKGKTLDMLPMGVRPQSDKREIQEVIAWLLRNPIVNFFGFTWSKVFKSDIINEFGIRFNPGLNIKEDEIFTLEYCKHICSIQVLSKLLYYYNIFNSSLSHSNTRIRYDILSNDYSSMANGFDSESLRRILMDLSVSYALGYARDLKRGKAAKQEVKEVLTSKVLPLLSRGYGLNAAIWMPYIDKLLPTFAKVSAIYFFL